MIKKKMSVVGKKYGVHLAKTGEAPDKVYTQKSFLRGNGTVLCSTADVGGYGKVKTVHTRGSEGIARRMLILRHCPGV